VHPSAATARRWAGAFLVSTDALFVTRRVQLVTLAARHAVPAMYFRCEFAEAGGLMSYGSKLVRVEQPEPGNCRGK